jgi:hypothetical protein
MDDMPRSFVREEREYRGHQQRVDRDPTHEAVAATRDEGNDEAGEGEDGECDLVPHETARAKPAEQVQVVPPGFFVTGQRGIAAKTVCGMGVGGERVGESRDICAE